MKKIISIIGSLLLAVVCLAVGASSAIGNQQSAMPNILFICIDDLRPQLGCYGNKQMKTPNIDRLAGQGVLFERAYCQFAICGPSRASVLSGMYSEHSGVRDNSKKFREALPDAVSLPQHFRQNGYHTVGMGKIFHHAANTDPASWDRWVDIQGRGYFLPENIADQKKRQAAIAAREATGETFTPHQKYVYTVGPFSEAADADEHLYPDGQLADRAVQVLREVRHDKQPFFLAVGFMKPHLPLVVPKKYWDLYNAEDFDLPVSDAMPAGAPAYAGHDSFELRCYSDGPKEGPLGDDVLRRAIHGYYAGCSFVDAQVGRVLDELKALGLDGNTVVVLWGDHGFHLGEHGIICKDTNYEVAAHSPLIIRAPSVTPERTARLVEFVDIFPTLCERSGLPVPAQCDGRSVFSTPWKTAAFTMNERKWAHPNSGYAMRTDRFRYVRWLNETGETVSEELYDYQASPAESINLVSDPEYRSELKSLRRKFDNESPVMNGGNKK
jgi:arylsulfatase A-like enzyme